MDRRNMLKITGATLASTSLLSMQALAQASSGKLSKPLFDDWHGPMEQFRGLEFRCRRAEAFIHLRRNNNDLF